jgi:hypothetical protein
MSQIANRLMDSKWRLKHINSDAIAKKDAIKLMDTPKKNRWIMINIDV